MSAPDQPNQPGYQDDREDPDKNFWVSQPFDEYPCERWTEEEGSMMKSPTMPPSADQCLMILAKIESLKLAPTEVNGRQWHMDEDWWIHGAPTHPEERVYSFWIDLTRDSTTDQAPGWGMVTYRSWPDGQSRDRGQDPDIPDSDIRVRLHHDPQTTNGVMSTSTSRPQQLSDADASLDLDEASAPSV